MIDIDIREINNIDLRLRLLSGDNLSIGNLKIDPLTVNEVKDVGYMNYNKYLGVLLLKKEDLVQENVPELDQFTVFDIILMSGNDVLINTFVDAISFFLKEDKDDIIGIEGGIVFGASKLDEAKVVNADIYSGLVEIIKFQNCVKNSSERIEVNTAMDERARRIAEKFKKSKEVVQKVKAKNNDAGDEIDFADIISAVSTKSNTYNKHTIWDATVYQLYDEYKRLEMISGYETNILAMVQGAKIDNLKHWSAKMEEE